ncbi:hypothetical protein EGW08_021081 [Elysia chlorotica]|uniref:Uncharacterized protein n=1 Tax=Elysia chlorotica TaxID=188477 RepID=A0A3S1AZG0_ELYCH|nr:hypothetical protein EGW08_021081 [Elysia chlorotica]
MGAATRHLVYDGSSDWSSHLYQFELCADSLFLGDVEKGRFLQSTLAGPALKLVADRNREGRALGFREICDILRRRFDCEDDRTEAAWLKLDNAFQEKGESLHQWADRLRDIGFRIARGALGAYGAVEHRLVLRFCLTGLDKEAGRTVIETGPPSDLETAVERVQWLQHVKSASRSRSWFEDSSKDYSRGGGNPHFWEDRDYRQRRDSDSPDHRSRGIWSGDGRVSSTDFREQRPPDYSPANRAVGRGVESPLEALTKTNLVEEVKGLGKRMESESKVRVTMDGCLQVLDNKVQTLERARRWSLSQSPRRRSPSHDNACFGRGSTNHFRSGCPKSPSSHFRIEEVLNMGIRVIHRLCVKT